MTNVVFSGTGRTDDVRRDRSYSGTWLPWALALLVLLSGFGLGALYASSSAAVTVAPEIQAQAASPNGPPQPLSAPGVVPISASLAQTSTPELGQTEVAFVTHFPLIEFEWEVVTLPIQNDFEPGWLGQIGDKYVIVGFSWPEYGTGQQLVTLTSPDGHDWTEEASFTLSNGSSVHQITGSDDRLLAFGENWAEDGSQAITLYSSADGLEWNEILLPAVGESTDYAYIHGAVANEVGIAVALMTESYPPEPPLVLEFDGFTVEVDHRSGTYTLTNSDDAVVATGSSEDIWHSQNDGQGIFDPETGELITVVPWQVWEQGWSEGHEGWQSGSPLPVPIESMEPYSAPQFVVEWDGFMITVDENEGVYEVVDAETGDVIVSALMEHLWRGPSPIFVDSDTNEVVLSVTWEEWEAAEMASWESYEDEAYIGDLYHTDAFVLFSADGIEWEKTAVSSSRYGASLAVMATDDTFVLDVTSYGEFGEYGSQWTSQDGIDWEVSEVGTGGELYLHNVVAVGVGLMGIGEGFGEQAVWSSVVGGNWQTEFAVGIQDDGQHVWLSRLADGPLGTVVTGMRESVRDFQPLVVSLDGMAAEFEGEYVVRITDDSTGEAVLALTWDDFDSGTAGEMVVYENEETRFFDAAGNLIMAIPDEVAFASLRDREESFSGTTQQIAFVEIDDEWFEVGIDAAPVDHVWGATVSDSQVVLGGIDWDDGYYWQEESDQSTSNIIILVGTPVD